ncbi:MAG: hypothetical protein IVW36_11355 [Dehalococcoidia bacterium]|nr:hypothetical protein [Dehalococcoidia bacterium]
MKKFLVAAAALAVAIIGFGALGTTTSYAAPTSVLVINQNVANALAGTGSPPVADLITPGGRAAAAAKVPLATLAQYSAGQISPAATAGGEVIIVAVDDPNAASTITLNGKGLLCTPVCDGTSASAQAPGSDLMAAWTVAGSSAGVGTYAGAVVTATQDSVSVDSGALKLVGPANDVQLTVTKPTIQEGAAANSCTFTANIAAPEVGAALATYTDINGNALVGYFPTFKSSSASTMAVGSSSGSLSTTSSTVVSYNITGTVIAGADTYCGVAAGTATLSASTLPAEISGQSGAVTRTQTITVTGVPANIALTASPAAIACDGTATSTVTAKVTDSAGNNVVDNTGVTFSVVALGTANPINTKTTAGTATSVITPLSGQTSGVVVNVTSGSAASSIRIDCTPSLATPGAGGTPGAANATPTGVTGVRPPVTGTGGYLNQDNSAGFPMWVLVALGLGSAALVAGGLVTRRAGK